MNDAMEYVATGGATTDAADVKAANCRGMFKTFVDVTSGISAPQAGFFGCLIVSAAGLMGYGIYALCDLAKSGHPVELTAGKVRFAANSAMLNKAELPFID